jgi:cytochrome b
MSEDAGMKTVAVWDLPVRVFHWLLVAFFLGLWVSGKTGELDIHMKMGMAVLSMLLFRLLWGFVGSSTARFSHFVAGPSGALDYLRTVREGRPWMGLGHNPLGGWSVMALLTVLLVQGSAGLFTSDDIFTDGPLAWTVSSATVKQLSAVHRLGSKLLLVLVALHVGAVVFYLMAKGENLVRPMLTGRKAVPPEQAGEAAGLRFGSPWLALALLAAAAVVVFGGVRFMAH